MKTKFLLDETHNVYEVGYSKFQSTFRGLHSVVTIRETLDEINQLTKDIKSHIINKSQMTTYDLSLLILSRFYRNYQLHEEVKALFEEKGLPSSSKGRKTPTIEVRSESPSP